MIYDYIIVGQGIAGTAVCHYLKKHNQNVLVIDPGNSNATTVAAGNINPITGRSYTKTWMLEELLEVLTVFYRDLEEILDQRILLDLDIFRTLRTIKDENRWMEREVNPTYKTYISSADDVDELDRFIKKPLSYGKITGGYQVQTKVLINSYREFLIGQKAFFQDMFDFGELIRKNGNILYKGFESRNIIFSEGHKVVDNPYFNYLPIIPTKGEVLIVGLQQKLEKSLRDQTFITPYGNNYWVGSNYDKSFSTEDPTNEGAIALRSKLDSFLNVEYNIIDHIAGIRPCVKDRRPIIGRHHSNENVIIFNGLGTKGTSLAPYFAKQLVEHLLKDEPIEKEVNVDRFDSYIKA